MPNDRSIRNIIVRHKHERAALPPEERAPRRKNRRSGRRLWVVALGIVFVAAGLGTLLSTVFAGATVTVTARQASVTLPSTILAQVDAPLGTLAYQTLTVTQSATTTVAANGTEQVHKQASGTLIISNAFTTAPQRLIANTRFQAPDGKIYRIRDSVVVPGMKGSTAGTVSVIAYADSPGPDYNRQGQTVYTIPGFKGDPRFAKITATSGAMSGGFVGVQAAVSPSDLQTTQMQLEQNLAASVSAAIKSNIPNGYEIVKGASGITYSDVTKSPNGTNSANLSQTATAIAAIIRVNDLAAAVAKQTVQGYQGEAVSFADPSSIALSAATSSKQTDTIQLQLSGTATLVWVFDQNAVKAALVGKPKSDFESIIKSFEPAIAKADATIRPFWTSSFPSDSSKISVLVAK